MRITPVLLLLVCVASTARAQHRARSGFWIDAGGGYGTARVTCLGCPSPTNAGGVAVTVSAGGTVSRYVLVGVEAQVWNGVGDTRHEEMRSLNLVAHWYPWGLRNGFYLRGGTGLVAGTVVVHDTTNARGVVRGSGLGIGFSLGWDVNLGRRVALTLQAGDQLTALGDLSNGGVSSDDTIAYLSRFQVGFTFR